MIHKNGGGIVEDEAEARPAAFVDSASRVIGRARAHSGKLISSTLAIEARFHNATAIRSMIACDEVTGGTIVECGLFSQVCLWDNPTLYHVEAYDGVRIYGDAVMIGRQDAPIKIYGDARIQFGTWHRAPLYRHLGFAFLTESAPGWCAVDCKFAPYTTWFRVGERFARRWYNWTPEMLAKVREVLTEWSANEDLRKKHWGRCVAGCAQY